MSRRVLELTTEDATSSQSGDKPLIDLAGLQLSLTTLFEEYDCAVDSGQTSHCLKVRSAICAKARATLRDQTTLHQTGHYVFLDREADGFAAVVYVGLVKGQDLATRIADYLVADISTLDPRLAQMSDQEAYARIDKRIIVTMPGTAEGTRAGYVRGHMKAREISRADTILFAPTPPHPFFLEDAETLLIATAHHGGAPLVNKKKVKWPPPPRAIDARAIACQAITVWEGGGLCSKVSLQWRSLIESINRGS